ncbi:PREDICTED: zinc finger protein 680-like [Galeopterus variegatus]|uniref:Zinc finger protein 680-like n=1 Tax=Galeopterus variegatus TaxID=482537 RepID=A0ABM0R0T2_GALVR|nr:PREDICTED: zinc finger protein 680-like [Galeopterus variegatus]
METIQMWHSSGTLNSGLTSGHQGIYTGENHYKCNEDGKLFNQFSQWITHKKNS